MYYAIKSVDNQIVDKIETDWNVCKKIVLGHDSIYKAFVKKSEAEEYIQRTSLEASFFTNENEQFKKNDTGKSIKVRYLFTRYEDKKNGFNISVYANKRGERITCKGYYLPQNKNLYYTFGGRYNLDQKNGFEFIVESYKAIIEDSKEGIIEYLSSGIIKGVGLKKAEAIYKEFGAQTMTVLEEQPQRLAYVKGFSKASAKAAIEQLNAVKGARDLTRFLLSYGISQKYAMELYTERKENALNYIKAHPYELCRFPSVSFEIADMVAESVGIPKNNKERLKICIFHVLSENEMTGNNGMYWGDFTKTLKEKLGPEVAVSEIQEYIRELCNNHSLYIFKDKNDENKSLVFSARMRAMEEDTAKNIIRINCDKLVISFDNIDELIAEREAYYGITLDINQKIAIKESLTGAPLIVITGGPGTGKTTIEKIIADIYEIKSQSIIFLAPTGRAARRMQETSLRPAHTINSYLHINNERDRSYNEDDVTIKNSLVVVDEFSMTDSYNADKLFAALIGGNRVILVGDDNQLPSVGPGAVLRDILNCKAIKSVELKTIFRQRNDEKIISNCAKINAGDGNVEEGRDFKFHEYSNMEDVRNVMIERYLDNVKKYGVENVMCLCPYKEHTAGVKEMNLSLQDKINPARESLPEIKNKDEILRLNDIVMHVERNTEDAANGDIGRIIDIDEETKTVRVLINNKVIEYDSDNLRHLRLSYAMTIHKSQGSEADAVILGYTTYHKAMLYKNLPYVACSRGKKMVEIVGEKEALIEACKREVKNKRITLLNKYLHLFTGDFVKF